MRVPSILQGLPDDLLTSYIVEQRALKVSSEDPLVAAALNDKAFTISGSYSIDNNNTMAMNIDFASDAVIKKVSVSDNLQAFVYKGHATGAADGIFTSNNLNTCSVDQSPSQGQIYYNATPVGNILASDYGSFKPYVVTCEDFDTSIVVKNTTGTIKEINITVTFEELGPRNPSFGITASTQLEPDTEMSAYG